MKERVYGSTPVELNQALGQSDVFLDFQDRLARVAPVDRPVLLLGERGTGKDLAASRLHFLSKRWEKPLLALNCAALSPSLIESELFGYEKGAFTGAGKRRTGRFEAAHGGTIFLDEMGNIPMEVQEKILRVVEYGAFERVGSATSIEVDVRIIAATNADLMGLVSKGLFMQDLLDRLSFEVLFVPPLRERKEDILLLANHFAARMAFELGRSEIPQFSKTAISRMEAYAWPGNIRELKNVVERAVYRSDSAFIRDINFDPFSSAQVVDRASPDELKAPEALPTIDGLLEKPFKEAVREFELLSIKRALNRTRFNQKKAAKMLGLTYHQFRGLYRKYHDELA
jgi:psp operon transcriptional activator